MKAAVFNSHRASLRSIAPGTPFQLGPGVECKCVFAVRSTDEQGSVRVIWDRNLPDHVHVVVLACQADPDDAGYRPAGASLVLSVDTPAYALEQVEPVSFRPL